MSRGKPQLNAYVERDNCPVRLEWLAQYIFQIIEEAQDYATRWLCTCNIDRPNKVIGGVAPKMKLKQPACIPV